MFSFVFYSRWGGHWGTLTDLVFLRNISNRAILKMTMQLNTVKLLDQDAQNLAGELIGLQIIFMTSYENHLVIFQSLDPKLLEIAKRYPGQ